MLGESPVTDSNLSDERGNVAGASAIEPELSGPMPRAIVSTWRVRAGRSAYAVFTILVPALFSYWGLIKHRTFEALVDRGATTTGELIEYHPAGHRRSAYLVFQYRVRGHTYQVREYSDTSRVIMMRRGDETPVRYLPESPADAVTERDLHAAEGTNTRGIGFWVCAGCVGLYCGVFWIHRERRHARMRRLLRYGNAISGVVESVKRLGTPSYYDWSVEYTFTSPAGTIRQGAAKLEKGDFAWLGGAGTAATILVDPANDEKFEIYCATTRLFRIVGTGPRS
jgi:hypothetical protein